MFGTICAQRLNQLRQYCRCYWKNWEATTLLISFLLIMFSAELIILGVSGYSSIKNMFDVLSPSENRLITGLVGYGLHHTAQHLYGNLQVIVLGGFLSEYALRRGDYVKLVLGGLLFPMWITAIIGGASIGASGMAFAYRGFVLFLPLVLIYYYMSGQSMQWTTLHKFFLFLTIAASLYLGGGGLLEFGRLVEANSGDITHALGFVWGMAYLLYLVITKADMDIGPRSHQSPKAKAKSHRSREKF